MTAWFYLLRPEEICADGRPGRRPSLRRSGVCLIRRVRGAHSTSWEECPGELADVALVFLAARKVDQVGFSTVIPRWRSGAALCPVGILAGYLRASGDRLARDGPLFPAATRAAMKEFIQTELAVLRVAGGGLRSPRRGGAAHLMAHLQDDTRRKLCAAGGWSARTQTAEDYAGITIEVTRRWSTLMVKPITLL